MNITFEHVKKYVDEIVTVGEEEIASAILQLLEREKTVVEGAGATPLAALLNRKVAVDGLGAGPATSSCSRPLLLMYPPHL